MVIIDNMSSINIIYSILSETFEIDIEKLDGTNRLLRDLGMDSLEIITFIAKIEEITEKEIADEHIEKVYTIEDAVKLLDVYR